MNFLDFQALGGMPLFKNDFRFLQESVREAIKGSLSFLPNNRVVVLTGMAAPAETYHPEGYVYYQGEVYHVEENDDVSTGTQLLWNFDPYFEASGNRSHLDTELMPHVARKARLVPFQGLPQNVPPGSIIFSLNGELNGDTVGYYDVLAARVDSVPIGMVMLWPFTEATIPNGWEQAIGQSHDYLGMGSMAGPDYRRAVIAGYDSAAAPPFNTVGNSQNGLEFDVDVSSSQRRVIGIWIVKVSSNVPAIFTY